MSTKIKESTARKLDAIFLLLLLGSGKSRKLCRQIDEPMDDEVVERNGEKELFFAAKLEEFKRNEFRY